MVEPDDLTLQQLDIGGVKNLLDWARKEGWNPGKHDFEVFWNTDPDGFYGFYLDDRLIAGGSVVSYDGEYGFMGLFIVDPHFRENGIGRKLWYLRRDLLLRRLKDGAPIGMDGVVDMQPFYSEGGFEIAFKDERYERLGMTAVLSQNISVIQDGDFDEIEEYDKHCFGFRRTEFLKHWLVLPGSKAFKYSVGNKLQGYAVIREVDSGFKIGPLFADNEEVAEELYKSCLNSAVDQPVYLDIPTTNKAAVNLVQKYGARYVFECARMYYGNEPDVHLHKVFGITTFELG
ncbi:MAG: hypothetical protein MI700_09855 [Balneolales bacterium]|nr:hypothetical protein [Balneolales bacterium]